LIEGGGCGAQLASWILHGRPQLDMFSYDIRFVTYVFSDNNVRTVGRSRTLFLKGTYHIISYHIVVLRRQNHLKVGTDKPKLKVKMQSVSDVDIRKRLLEKPRFELAMKHVFRLGRSYRRSRYSCTLPCEKYFFCISRFDL